MPAAHPAQAAAPRRTLNLAQEAKTAQAQAAQATRTAPVVHPAHRPFPRTPRWLALGLAAALAGCVVAPPRHGHAPSRAALPSPAPAVASTPMYFYPEQGQPEALQDRDRYECYRWAVRESGVDPGMTPVRQVPVAQPAAPMRRADPAAGAAAPIAGAVAGAVVGAAVSSPRHAAENAVIGAIFGAAIAGAAQNQRDQAAEAQQARREQAQYQAQQQSLAARGPLDNFRRAMSACMQGRGYRVG